MPKIYQITVTCLLTLLPLLASAQTCQTQTITYTTPTARFTSFNNGTVLDKYTGLMWKKCSEGQLWNAVSHTCNLVAARYTWQQALQRVQKQNTTTGFAKYKDWRVPNIKELRTLVEEQCTSPAINLSVFPFIKPDAVFWSSSPNAYNGDGAWGVDFGFGSANWYYLKDFSYQVRLVRSGQ
jgi:Protein of unknown function (DUF1566)